MFIFLSALAGCIVRYYLINYFELNMVELRDFLFAHISACLTTTIMFIISENILQETSTMKAGVDKPVLFMSEESDTDRYTARVSRGQSSTTILIQKPERPENIITHALRRSSSGNFGVIKELDIGAYITDRMPLHAKFVNFTDQVRLDKQYPETFIHPKSGEEFARINRCDVKDSQIDDDAINVYPAVAVDLVRSDPNRYSMCYKYRSIRI